MATESNQTAGPFVKVAYTDAVYAEPTAIDTGKSMLYGSKLHPAGPGNHFSRNCTGPKSLLAPTPNVWRIQRQPYALTQTVHGAPANPAVTERIIHTSCVHVDFTKERNIALEYRQCLERSSAAKHMISKRVTGAHMPLATQKLPCNTPTLSSHQRSAPFHASNTPTPSSVSETKKQFSINNTKRDDQQRAPTSYTRRRNLTNTSVDTRRPTRPRPMRTSTVWFYTAAVRS